MIERLLKLYLYFSGLNLVSLVLTWSRPGLDLVSLFSLVLTWFLWYKPGLFVSGLNLVSLVSVSGLNLVPLA